MWQATRGCIQIVVFLGHHLSGLLLLLVRATDDLALAEELLALLEHVCVKDVER
jgi:hypothetical protein